MVKAPTKLTRNIEIPRALLFKVLFRPQYVMVAVESYDVLDNFLIPVHRR
jgi:hypothetical protein